MLVLKANVFDKPIIKIKFVTMCSITFLNFFVGSIMIEHPLFQLYFKCIGHILQSNFICFQLILGLLSNCLIAIASSHDYI